MLSAYLGKIVRNLSFNLYKRKRAEKRGAGNITIVLNELAELIADPSSTEDAWNEKMLAETLNYFLASLPAKKRKIFVCRYWYADSVKDIAERFGMRENNVSVALSRLRTKLHNYLMESGFEL